MSTTSGGEEQAVPPPSPPHQVFHIAWLLRLRHSWYHARVVRKSQQALTLSVPAGWWAYVRVERRVCFKNFSALSRPALLIRVRKMAVLESGRSRCPFGNGHTERSGFVYGWVRLPCSRRCLSPS